MIHRVTSNRPSFRAVEFGPGLNVVLADRTEASTDKDTRNGLGKSTLIDIIDFCLGARAQRGKGLVIDSLAGWEFTLEFSMGRERFTATRAVDAPNKFKVARHGSTAAHSSDTLFGDTDYNQADWRTLLGQRMFGLDNTDIPRYGPSYRSLLSYFVRRDGAAYLEPFSHHSRQQPWDRQVNVAYMLGLHWKTASQGQNLKENEKSVKQLQRAADAVEELERGATVGALEATRVRLEDRLNAELNALDNFKVHPQYASIQQEADRLTVKLHELTNENVADQRMLRRYRESVDDKERPPSVSVARLYQEVGIVFSDAVRRTLAETKQFRNQIIENRKQFLATEISRIETRIAGRDREIQALTEERADHLVVLKTHGALDEVTRLQERIVRIRERLEKVTTSIDDRKALESKKREIKTQKNELAQVAQRAHEERRTLWSRAIALFNENSEALYEAPGELIIDVGDNGFSYDVEIDKSGSDGVDKMKIFCFDLMLLQSRPEREGIDFLIHDSIIFDGVDSRQRARALERASAVGNVLGKQYICAFNSDMVPRDDFSRDFDFDRHVKLHLKDGDPSGSLLGFSFNR